MTLSYFMHNILNFLILNNIIFNTKYIYFKNLYTINAVYIFNNGFYIYF